MYMIWPAGLATAARVFGVNLLVSLNIVRVWSISCHWHHTDSMAEERRLKEVMGYDGKTNDVYFYGSMQVASKQNVLYFAGDVQDYADIMMTHRDNKRYVKWSLEETAQHLLKRFPDSHIWAIKAKQKKLITFNIYSNLVPSLDLGNPRHEEGYKSWHHLNALLSSAVKEMQASVNNQGSCDTEACSDIFAIQRPVTMVAFSKGCIVLNQLLYDLAEAKADPETSEFVRSVHHMFWLDGGHNGGCEAYIVHDHILANLADLDMVVHSHITPYQVDPNRIWIAKEQKKFVEKLRKLGVKVNTFMHFEDEERCLENHFKILTVF